MKNFFYHFEKGKMLLAVLTTWFVGTSAAWSEVYTEDFNSMSPSDFKTAYDVTDDPTAWYVINGTIDGYGGGSYTISNDVYRVGENGEKGKAVWTANGTNDAFIVTPKMQGKCDDLFSALQQVCRFGDCLRSHIKRNHIYKRDRGVGLKNLSPG